MPEEPSNGELDRRLQAMHLDLKEDFRELAKRLDAKVSVERYEIERRNRDEVHVQLSERIAALEQARTRDRQAADQARQKAEDQRRSDRRLAFAALIAPVVIVLLQAYLAAKGAGT